MRPARFAGRRIDRTTATAVAVAGAAALLRVPRLADPFWQDEVASARILREPTVGRMLAHVARTESTPPLWYALAWLAHRLGAPLQDVRGLSVLFGAVLAGLTVVAARAVLPLAPAALAGVLVAVGGQFAAAGWELRAYALLALLSVVFALALERAVTQPARWSAAVLVLVTSAGLLTHYFFAFTAAAGGAWLWLEPHARSSRRRVTLALLGGAALAAPWLPFAVRQYRQDRFSWIGGFDGKVVANTAFRLFTPLVQTEWVPLVFLLLVVAGAVRLARSSPRGRLFAALGLGPLLAAAVVWRLGVRVYADRNLIEVGAFLAVCAAAGLAAFAPRVRTAVVVALGVAALAGFVWDQRAPGAPYARIAAALVSEGWSPTQPVMVFGSPYAFRSPLEWYLPRDPRLAIVGPARSDCRIGYVVAGRRAARGVADDVLDGQTVGRFLVARARLDDRARDASLLAAPAARTRCEA